MFEDTVILAHEWIAGIGGIRGPEGTPLLVEWRHSFPDQEPPPLLEFLAAAELGMELTPVQHAALLMLDATPYSKEGWSVLMDASRRIVDVTD